MTITATDQRRATDQILDVREDFEITGGMIPGALHRARPVIVICRSGNRSAAVALTGAGYTADSMAGGMVAWQRAGLPVT